MAQFSKWWLVLCLGAVFSASGCDSGWQAPYRQSYRPRIVTLDNTDESLTVEEYVSRGMPAITRSWAVSERSDALEALLAIYRDKPGALPRLDSPRSKPLFDKLVGSEVMKDVLDSSAPAQARLMKLSGAAVYELTLLQLYTLAHARSGMYDDELSLLVARSVWMEATNLELRLSSMRDGMPAIFTDPNHEMDTLREDIQRTMIGLTKLLRSDVLFGDSARLRMVNGVMPSAKKLLDELDPLTHREFRAAMLRAKTEQTDSRVRVAYDSLTALNDSPGSSQIDAVLASRPRAPRADGVWTRYDSKSAGLSAEFPGRPLERVRQGGLNADEPSVVYSVWMQTDDGVRFTLLRIRGLTDEKTRDDYVRKFDRLMPKRSVTKSRMLDKEAMLTKEVEFRFNHVGLVRVIASGDDVTHVIVESTGTDSSALRRKAERFFKTLKVEPFKLSLPNRSNEQVTLAE